MEVKIKKLHNDAIIPTYAKNGDAGMDLTCVEMESIDYDLIKYKTGISVEIPKGYVGLCFPRSSVYKTGQMLSNCVGVIDSGYRGEISFNYYNVDSDIKGMYGVGDRIGQLIIIPYSQIEFKEVDELSETERGEGGFGSTGK